MDWKLFADLYIELEFPQILGSILQDDVIFKEGELGPRQNTKNGEASNDNFIRHKEIFQTK